MEFEDALFKWVATQPSITGLIGAAPQQVRFHKLQIPQSGKTPAMVQQRSGARRQELYCKEDGAVAISMQIDSYARSWPEMAATAKAFRRALRKDNATYPLLMGEGDSPATAIRVKAATCETEFDFSDPEPGLYRRTQIWTFWVFEP